MNEERIINIAFGIAGIVIHLLLLVIVIIFILKKIDRNSVFGYRTKFSLSSDEKWEWSNKVFNISSIIFSPILLVTNIVLLVLSFSHDINNLIMTLMMFSSIICIFALIPFIEIIGRIKFKNK